MQVEFSEATEDLTEPYINTVIKLLLSEAAVSLAEASEEVKDAIDEDAVAVKSELKMIRDFLVYEVVAVDEDDETSRAIVDAGNGDVLSIEEVSGKALSFATQNNEEHRFSDEDLRKLDAILSKIDDG